MTTIPIQGIVSGQTVTRKRRATGSYVDGEYVKGAITSTDVKASVQIYDRFSNDSQNLPEGSRLKDWIEVYSLPDTFRNSDDTTNVTADLITYNGHDYEVKQVHLWKGTFLAHDRVFAVRVS
jgi:hypothetical protein